MMAEEKDEKTGKTKTRAIVVLMRGDHQLNEAKLNGTVATATRPMEEERDQGTVQIPCGIFGAIGD